MNPDSIYNTVDKNLYKLSTGVQPDYNLQSPNSLDNDLSTVGGRVLPVALGGNIQAAIDTVAKAGGGEVRLLAGIYNLASDIHIKTNVTLAGSGFGTILDFGGNDAGVRAEGDLIYNTGTVSINNGSTTLTGSGTTWTSAMEGYTINFGGSPFIVDSVDSATQITIDVEYYGDTLSGSGYAIFDPVANVIMNHMVIQNSGGTGIYGQYIAGEFQMYFVNVYNCAVGINIDRVTYPYFVVTVVGTTAGNGITVTNSIGVALELSSALYTTGHGLSFDGVINSAVHNSEFSESSGDGIRITNSSYIGFENLTVNKNAGQGAELVSNNKEIAFNQINFSNNGSDGIKLTATSDRCIIMENNFSNNGGYGVNIAAATDDNNIVVHNTYSGNVSGTLTDSGTATITDNTLGSFTLAQLNAAVSDADVARIDAANSFTGIQTFGSDPLIPDEAYGSGWNGVLEPPTKNAVYDKIETISSGADFLVVQVFS